MSAITIDNDLVHYEVLGRGRPVILLHGWLGSWRYWVPAMQQLSAKYRVYALDLWGFGDSGKNAQRYGFASQVLLLGQFMDKMGIAKAALVGHDLGAAVAAHYAVRHADRVPRLMAVCPPLFKIETGIIDVLPKDTTSAPPPGPETVATEAETIPQPTDEMRARLEAALEQRAREIGQAALRARALREAARPPIARAKPELSDAPDPADGSGPNGERGENPLKRYLGDLDRAAALLDRHVDAGPDLDKLKIEVSKADPRVLMINIESLAGVDTLGALKALSMPVVALYGANDTLLPAPDADMLADLRRDHRPFHVVRLADIRHFPMLEDVAGFNRLLLDFLEAPDVTKLKIKKKWERRVR